MLQRFKKVKISNLFEFLKGSKSKKLQQIEEKDSFLGTSFSILADSLNSPPLQRKHPLHSLSKSFKNEIIKYQTASDMEVGITPPSSSSFSSFPLLLFSCDSIDILFSWLILFKIL